MRHATHAADSRARDLSKRADESVEGAREHFDSQKSVTLMSQRDHEIGPRESRAKVLARRRARPLTRLRGRRIALSAGMKKHEL